MLSIKRKGIRPHLIIDAFCKLKFIFCVLCFLVSSFSNYVEAAISHASANGKIVSNVHGPLGESYMDTYFLQQGWEKLEGEVGRNGIDGLYVRRGKNGEILKVMVAESKFGSSKLKMACSAPQMSHAWSLCKLDALEQSIQKKKTILEKKKQSGFLHKDEKQELQKLQHQEKDIKQVRKHIVNGSYRRRIFRSRVKAGMLEVDISDVKESNGKLQEKSPDQRAKVESGEAYENVKKTRRISLENPPKAGNDLKVYKGYFGQIEKGLEKSGMPENEAKQATKDLKLAYKEGRVVNGKGSQGQAGFLREKLIASLEKQPKTARTRTILALLKLSKKMKNILIPNWHINGIHSVKKSIAPPRVGGKSIKYIRGILTKNGKVIARFPKGVVGGLSAGIAVFVLDAGTTSYGFAKGVIFRPEFERKLVDGAVKGAVTLMLVTGPGGWVVYGVGMAGYFITDLALQSWHKYQDRKVLSRNDLSLFGIEMKDTIPLNVGNWSHNKPLQFGY